MGDDELADAGLWQEACERVDAAAAAGRSVVDRFLLAVIDAHPEEGSSREQRLSDAREALIGAAKSKGRSSVDDHDRLMEMAHAYISERAELELRIPDEELKPSAGTSSLRQLAKTEAEREPGQSLPSTEDRLRKKFASDKRRYILMALHSVRRDERWCNSDTDDLMRELRLVEPRGASRSAEVESAHASSSKNK